MKFLLFSCLSQMCKSLRSLSSLTPFSQVPHRATSFSLSPSQWLPPAMPPFAPRSLNWLSNVQTHFLPIPSLHLSRDSFSKATSLLLVRPLPKLSIALKNDCQILTTAVYSNRPTFLAQACALLLHSGRSRPSSCFFHFQECPLLPACRACSSSLCLVLFQGPQPYLSLNVSSSRTPSLSLTGHLRASSCDKFSFHLAFISEPSSQFQLNKILYCHMFLPRL